MKHRKSVVGLVSLIIGIFVYYSLAIIAIFQYPGGFDIFNDLWTHLRWLGYNPNGALFIRIGNFVYALTLVFFFLSFSRWITDERRFRIYLIQIFGILIATSMIIGEILADQVTIFIISSGVGLLLTIITLLGIASSLYGHPEFWKASITLFIISIVLSSYLLYMGIIDAPIQEFRIIDFLVTALNQASIFVIALNMTKIQSQ